MMFKDLIGTYKIIDKLEEIEQQYNKNVLDICNICEEFFDNNNVIEMIRSIMFLREINSNMLSDTLKSNKIVLSNYDKRLLFRKLEKCQKNVRVWIFNGFTQDEFSKLEENR